MTDWLTDGIEVAGTYKTFYAIRQQGQLVGLLLILIVIDFLFARLPSLQFVSYERAQASHHIACRLVSAVSDNGRRAMIALFVHNGRSIDSKERSYDTNTKEEESNKTVANIIIIWHMQWLRISGKDPRGVAKLYRVSLILNENHSKIMLST